VVVRVRLRLQQATMAGLSGSARGPEALVTAVHNFTQRVRRVFETLAPEGLGCDHGHSPVPATLRSPQAALWHTALGIAVREGTERLQKRLL
jgi:hypothetical protein